jgi:hypothetical protein
MFRAMLAAVLVSAVAGCVTSDGPYSKSAVVSAQRQQTKQAADRGARSPQSTQPPVVLGASY